jgi:hypothetical protein
MKGRNMIGLSGKSVIRAVTAGVVGLLVIAVLPISDDAVGRIKMTEHAINRGKTWAGTCKKSARPSTCCHRKDTSCNQTCESALPTGELQSECFTDCADSLTMCLRGVEKSGFHAPTLGTPQKVAPTAPMSPKPGQTAPQPGVLAPTPTQPLLNRPSKTAPQQKVIE